MWARIWEIGCGSVSPLSFRRGTDKPSKICRSEATLLILLLVEPQTPIRSILKNTGRTPSVQQET